jgi:putative colanic acid biosynthesis acetyltransferase WcaF
MTADFKKYKYENTHSLKNKVLRLLWQVVWCLFFRLSPRYGFNFLRIFVLRIFGAKIGTSCIIFPSVKIWAPWNLSLGDYVCLAERVNCYSIEHIFIGNKVTVSEGAFLCTASHLVESLDRPLFAKRIFLEDFSWVCAEAFIGPGVQVQEGSIIGARSVIFKDVEAWNVVAGNPAKFIKKRVIK